MKNFKVLPLILLLFTAFNFTSCTDDLEPVDPAIVIPGPNDPENPGPGVFTAKIDGTTYTAGMTTVYITGQAIQIAATRAQGDGFAFLLNGTSTGTYNTPTNLLTYNPAGSEYGYWGMNPDNMDQNVGSLTITEINTVARTISGTFSFTGYWSDEAQTPYPAPKQITEGVFTNLPYVMTSPTNDVFVAKVNGVDFNQNNLLVAEIADYISIGAENASDAAITVSVKNSAGAGTYAITGNTTADMVQINYSPDGVDDGFASSGSVTITQKTTTRIKGTFTGVVTVNGTTYNLTNGSFDVAY